MALQVELAEAGQTVRPAAVLGPALFQVAGRWREVGRSPVRGGARTSDQWRGRATKGAS